MYRKIVNISIFYGIPKAEIQPNNLNKMFNSCMLNQKRNWPYGKYAVLPTNISNITYHYLKKKEKTLKLHKFYIEFRARVYLVDFDFFLFLQTLVD